MVKKKLKTSRPGKRRAEVLQEEDVQVNTGLPPQVEGQLRCFCRVCVTQITWQVPNTPDVTLVRMKWWGEPGDGVFFKPLDIRKGNQSQAKTRARYAVRSGPKQFSSYLSDMGSVVLEVLGGPLHVPIGTVEVPNIGVLAPNRPVNGLYPVISPTEDKIGELHVSLMIESLMASYDSTGSIPTTDLSMETQASHVTQESTYPKQSHPLPHTDQPRKPVEDPFISPASHHQNSETRIRNGYADDLRQTLYEADHSDKKYLPIETGSTVAITTNGDVIRADLHGEPSKSNKENILPSLNQASTSGGTDLLSVLLNKGNKLREQMIISALDSKSKSDTHVIEDTQPQNIVTALPDPPTGILQNRDDCNRSLRSNDGSFLREILKAEKLHGITAEPHLDEATVDLVFGGQLTDDIRMLKNLHGSPNNSISGEDDMISDHEDPVHNESILNELFYKNPASSDELSEISCDELNVEKKKILEDESNMRPPSRASSVSSLNLAFPPPPVEKKQKMPRTPKRKSRLKLRRKGSKKRKGSRSRSRASASECSDSEALSTASTPRSESSRVSFDMVPSDIEEPPSKDDIRSKVKKSSSVDGLSVERLTLLGRVHVARVTIENLHLIGQDLNSSTNKPKSKTRYGLKPPRPSPKAKKSCTYFIEYQFPVVATSRDKYSPNAMATEVMRVVSRNEKNGVVNFNHRSVFPILFDGAVVERWWKYALVFKVFSRQAGQKVPNLIGSCGIPLKTILKSESLHIGREIDVKYSEKTGNTSLNGSNVGQDGSIGSLKIIVELASDSKEFPTALARTKLAEMTGKAKIVPIAQSNPQPPAQQPARPPIAPVVNRPLVHEPSQSAPRGLESRSRSRSPLGQKKKDSAGERLTVPAQVSVQDYQGDQTVLNYPSVPQQEGEALTLHALLVVPDGRNISMQGIPSLLAAKKRPFFSQPTAHTAPGVRARDLTVRNTYLVCRMFWCDEAVHSAVCWGTSEPQFKFQQVAPVLLSPSLLERMKNNFMIVEVWDKKTSADNDKLVGIVKLSLHQFYISFRDKRICSALLKSQYPVIAVENYLPVVDLFTGSQFGQINVLLAMGSAEQIAHLMRMKTEGASATAAPERPAHYLERQDLLHQNDTVAAQIGTECVVEHVFEIVVEGVRGLNMFENMIWGEADCFVQYHFPAQQQTTQPGAPVIRHAVPTMKTFRTATTLCVGDPTFNDVTRHRILLPQGTPVQRELLTACANSWGGANGLPFELWARYYHPNVRDQCIAKSSLPLAKLCAMITMQKRGEASVQTFSFPLTQVSGVNPDNKNDVKAKPQDTGLIDITVHYKSQVIQNDNSVAAANKNLTGAQVCISVGIMKACGLKAAAESAAHLDHGMQYPAEVGVNAYVRAKLSFLGSEGERITRTIARSFAPEFSHFMDFPCPLLWTEADTDALCLAELLETAEAVFEVWHQVPGVSTDLDQQLRALTADTVSGRKLVEKSSDVLLGSTTIPLVTLLSHRTGINGWFPVNIPVSEWKSGEADIQSTGSEGGHGNKGLQRVGGGLEIAVKFAHHEDRERVLHAARGVGWSPVDVDIEQDDWESEDEDSNKYYHVNITIDHVNFPLQNALIAGHNTLDKTAKCYVRYKFYDKAAVMTKLSAMTVNNDGYITTQPRNKHDLQIPDSSMFRWYLREEKLEVQVWVSYGHRNEDQQRPKHRDKLIGTAYISMETLSDPRRKQHRVSGMYPLYKPGAVNLGGGYIRAHLTARPQFGRDGQAERQEGLITIEGEDIDADYDPDDSFHQIVSHKTANVASETPEKLETPDQDQQEDGEMGSTFSVMIQVERALHLPLIRDKQKAEDYMPNTYVSYQTAESTIPSYSSVFHNSDNPVWDHEHETKLSTDMLVLENKHLVFKVWHKPDGAPKSPDKLTDRVLGFVSVDLTPLNNGLQQICGWYNVMDFNGQVKGQIKINVIPQESVMCSRQDVISHQACTSTSFLSLPVWGSNLPSSNQERFSLPSFGTQHMNTHYEQVKQHHEMLQRQLQEHIQQFLRQQEESQMSELPSVSMPQVSHTSLVTDNVTQGLPESVSSIQQPEPSIHWRPAWPDMRQEESASRSYLFSSLRQNLKDLDEVTNKLKSKLTVSPSILPSQFMDNPHFTTDFDVPVSSQTGQYPLTSTQSTISSFELPKSQHETPRDELAGTGSQGGESSRTAGDSGAFLSTERSHEKYEDSAPVSQRSVGDQPDVRTSSVTPRDLLMTADSGINYSGNNSNHEELGIGLTLSPRNSHEKNDEYSASGGFIYRHSPRDVNMLTPRENGNTQTPRENGSSHLKSGSSPRDYLNYHLTGKKEEKASTNDEFDMPEENTFRKSDQKQMSIIQEFPENDDSNSEDENENRYYHRYRDMLDDKEEEEAYLVDSDNDADEVVVPRRINDVSGKFSPVGEVTSLNGETSNTVPYEVTSLYSSKVAVPNSGVSEDIEENKDCLKAESDSETEIEPRASLEMTSQNAVTFDEKDSWLSDSDKEEEKDFQEGRHKHMEKQEPPTRPKHQRQDSDTGYSSRDNVSESYLTPSAAGTNSETDMSRLHEHEHWEAPVSYKTKHKLLSNVELESTGGSFGLKTDSGHHSRISSAESRHTRLSSVPSITESYEHEEDDPDHDLEGHKDVDLESKPLSARTEELEDFFSSGQNNSHKQGFQLNSETIEKDINSPRDMDSDKQSVSDYDPHDIGDDVEVDIHDNSSFQNNVVENMPNFFMPEHDMAESLKTLQLLGTESADPQQQREKASAASEMVAKLTTKDKFKQNNHKTRLPTAEETKRIAKIFSSKFSS